MRRIPLAAFVLGAVLAHRAEALVVKVCLDQANPSSSVDARVAGAALATQGDAIEPVYFVGHGKEADDGFPVGRFAKLAQSECELIMGFPVDVSAPHLPPNVQATPAYASTGFVVVQRGSTVPRNLTELPHGSEVGIAQLDTWAGTLFAAHANITMHVYAEDAQMLDELAQGRIVAGLTWQPFLQAYEKTNTGKHLSSRILPGPHMAWNLVALYAPKAQESADRFKQGLETLRAAGKLDALIEPYAQAVPDPPPLSQRTSVARSLRGAGARRCDSTKPSKASKPGTKKMPPALYTETQATQGATFYFQNCGMCHGPLLDGQKGGYAGPALKGEEFADPSYDFHVDEIFRFVAKLMPAATPGSLSDETNVDIMAFILKQNGYPAGDTELTYAGAMKSRVPIRYYGN